MGYSIVPTKPSPQHQHQLTSGGYDGWLTGIVAGIDRKKDEWGLGVALGIGISEMESIDDFVNINTDMFTVIK